MGGNFTFLRVLKLNKEQAFQFLILSPLILTVLNWVLEYHTLIRLFFVLGSSYSYLYLKSIYICFSRVYSKVGLIGIIPGGTIIPIKDC